MATRWPKKGKVKKALDTSLFASVFGGLFSAVLLLLCASLITKLVANFTSVEYFSLGIMGISLIAGVSGSSLPKSLISGMIGLLMACVGMDAVTGVTRFSFGSATLKYGIDMLPAMIALIALTQVVQKLRDFKVSGGKLDDARKIDKQGITKKEMISMHPARLPAFFRNRKVFWAQCPVSAAVWHSSSATTKSAALPSTPKSSAKAAWRASLPPNLPTTRSLVPL